jgi:hypothetical protein
MNNKFSARVVKKICAGNSKLSAFVMILTITLTMPINFYGQRTAKPVLHG